MARRRGEMIHSEMLYVHGMYPMFRKSFFLHRICGFLRVSCGEGRTESEPDKREGTSWYEDREERKKIHPDTVGFLRGDLQ